MNKIRHEILNLIDCEKLNEMIEQLNVNQMTKKSKYFEMEKEISRKLKHCFDLKLDMIDKKRILDISCGLGLFAFISKNYFKHDVVVTDKKDIIYDNIRKMIFGLNKIELHYSNYKFIPLPDTIGDFDIITAFNVPPMSFWDLQIWKQFIENSLLHLVENGFIYIILNKSTEQEKNKFEELLGNIQKIHQNSYIDDKKIVIYK